MFKASKIITHLKKFSVDEEIIDKVFSPLDVFASKPAKHLVLFQTPGNVKGNVDKLKEFMNLLPKTFLYAFEFRHETWFSEEIYNLLKKYNASVVLSDSPRRVGDDRLWPLHDIDTADFSYIRFHGSEKLYYSSYTDEELIYYADLIKSKIKRKMNVYCYFNNDAGGYATRNALKLKDLVCA